MCPIDIWNGIQRDPIVLMGLSTPLDNIEYVQNSTPIPLNPNNPIQFCNGIPLKPLDPFGAGKKNHRFTNNLNLSLNFHRFVISYRSCGTRSVGLGQYCLPKGSNGFKKLYENWAKDYRLIEHAKRVHIYYFVLLYILVYILFCLGRININNNIKRG